jgi:hypothetical protein
MHQIFFPPKSLLIKSRYKRNLLRANNKLSPFTTNSSLTRIQNDDHLQQRVRREMKKKKLSEKENDEEEKDESKIDSFLHPIDASLTHLASKIERVCFPSLRAREILGEEKEASDGVVRFYLYTFSLSLSKNVSLSAAFISFLSL